MANRNLNHLKLRKTTPKLFRIAFWAENPLSLSTICCSYPPSNLGTKPEDEENRPSVCTSRRSQRWSQYIIEKQIPQIHTNPMLDGSTFTSFTFFPSPTQQIHPKTPTCLFWSSLSPTSCHFSLPKKTSWKPADSDLVEIGSNQHRTNTGLCNMLPWPRLLEGFMGWFGCGFPTRV